jgi:hypothetical protein
VDCLHCGDCCRRMSPLSEPDPCPHIIERERDGQKYTLCGIYEHRPEECRKHVFHARVCPIGASLLDIPTTDRLHKRIDDGFNLSKESCFVKVICDNCSGKGLVDSQSRGDDHVGKEKCRRCHGYGYSLEESGYEDWSYL